VRLSEIIGYLARNRDLTSRQFKRQRCIKGCEQSTTFHWARYRVEAFELTPSSKQKQLQKQRFIEGNSLP
jgi:hypothetical protein